MTTLNDVGALLFVIAFVLCMIAIRIGVPTSEIRFLWIAVAVVCTVARVWP